MMPQPNSPFERPNFNSGLSNASKMRASVFLKLQGMIDQLDILAIGFGYEPGQVDILVFEGLRDLGTQKMLLDKKLEEILLSNPDMSFEMAEKETTKWVSPVKTDFTYSDKELKSGYINFMDHIPKLTEGCKDKLAFVTFINGVSVTENDFIEMGEGLSREFPKGTLFIGVYNQTNGVVKDMFRACLEILGVTTKSTRILQCLNVSLLDIMEKHNPEAYYLHIGHSEGGLITRRAYEKMKLSDKERMQEHVAALGVAGALSIKQESAKFSLNMYSMLDFVTGGLGLCSSSGCNTKILKPISPCHQRMFGIIEHGFFIDTYKNERKNFIDRCQNERGGIHEIRQR